MKNLFGYVTVLALLAVPAVSLAAEFRTGDQPSVGANEQIANDLYIMGGSVSSAATISGDLVAGGGNVVISGDVGADVIAGGGNVNIVSNVGDDLRVGGGNIYIKGKIGGDVVAGGGQISITGAGVGGDVMAGGGDVRIEAPVAGNLTFGGGKIYINAPISGDVKIDADSVTLGSGAVISGNLDYASGSALVKDAGAIVIGKITHDQRLGKEIAPVALAAILSAFLVWKFFALLACTLVVALIFRRYCREMVNLATKRPLLEFGRGLITLAAMPVISVLLLITVVGIPLGILGMLAFAILFLFSWIIAPIILGSVAYRYFSKKDLEVSWKTILLGVFLYTLIGLVPFIGALAKFLLMMLALGCIASLKWRLAKDWR